MKYDVYIYMMNYRAGANTIYIRMPNMVYLLPNAAMVRVCTQPRDFES